MLQETSAKRRSKERDKHRLSCHKAGLVAKSRSYLVNPDMQKRPEEVQHMAHQPPKFTIGEVVLQYWAPFFAKPERTQILRKKDLPRWYRSKVLTLPWYEPSRMYAGHACTGWFYDLC
jgi:hypothetical protein